MADFGAFLSNVALGAGRNIQYGQQMEERQAQLDDIRSQTAARNERTQLEKDTFIQNSGILQKKAAADAQKKKDMSDIASATAARDKIEASPVESAQAEAKMWEQRSDELWKKGYTAEAEQASKEAKRAADKVKEFTQIAKEQKASRVESVGTAANDLLTAMDKGGVTPELLNNYLKTTAEAGMPSPSMGGTGFGKENQPGAGGYDLFSPQGKTELILAAQRSADVRKLRESEAKIETERNRTAETHEYHQQLAAAAQERIRAAAVKQENSKVSMSDDEIKSGGAQAASGMPLTQIVPGTRSDSSSAREQVRAEAIRQIRDENPEMDAATAGRILADRGIAYKARSSGATASARTAGTTATNMEIAGNEARTMVEVARKYSAAADTGRFKSLNALENYASENTGDVPIVQLKASLNSLVNSYARAISPKGVPTVSDKQHARETIDAALSKGQLAGVFDVMEQEMEAAHGAAKGVVDKTNNPGGSAGGKSGALPPGFTEDK